MSRIKAALTDVTVEEGGKRISYPPDLTPREAAKKLIEYDQEQKRDVSVKGDIDAHPYDAAYALLATMKEMYGWASLRPTPGFFGDTPPAMVDVPVSHDESVQVPWGTLAVPGVHGTIQIGSRATSDGRVVGHISSNTIRRDESKVQELIRNTREYVRENSIFRNKAFRVRFRGENGRPVEVVEPRFLRLRTSPSDLVLPRATRHAIESSIWTPIRYPDDCLQVGAPLSRGVVLDGAYGTGKTMTAAVTARIAVENEWTFLYVEDVRELPEAVRLATQYGRTVIFAEDVDRIAQERDETLNEILNTVDGIESKGSEVVLVLTTNHAGRIHDSLLRSGRIDDLVHIPTADAESAEALVRVYGRGHVSEDEDLSEVAERLSGLIPSAIREVVELSKYSAIHRIRGGEPPEGALGEFNITASDLMRTAERVLNEESPRTRVLRGEMRDDAGFLQDPDQSDENGIPSTPEKEAVVA